MSMLKNLIEPVTLKEGKNHMGEAEYQSKSSWKAALKKLHPTVWYFEDDGTIDAFIGEKPFKNGKTKQVGYWDDTVGTVHDVKPIDEAKVKSIDDLRAERKAVMDKMDLIVQAGGRIMQNDPLMVKAAALKLAIAKLKSAPMKEDSVRPRRRPTDWFENGAKVKLMPDYADKDPNEVFTLSNVDGLRGRISDDDGRGWNITISKVYPARGESKNYMESAELQSIGKSLAGKVEPKAEEPTDVNTPPAEKDAEAAKTAPDAGAEEKKISVGDLVKPTKGPHKDEVHVVTRVFPNGSMNIVPKDVDPANVKYPQAGTNAQPSEVVLAESKMLGLFTKGSLFAQVNIDLIEAGRATKKFEAK